MYDLGILRDFSDVQSKNCVFSKNGTLLSTFLLAELRSFWGYFFNTNRQKSKRKKY